MSDATLERQPHREDLLHRGARRLSALALIAVLLWPGEATACPVCAAGESQDGGASSLLLALFIGAPFVVFAVAALSIRRLLRDPDRR